MPDRQIVIRIQRATSGGDPVTSALAEASGSIGRALNEATGNKLVLPDVADASPELDSFIQALNHKAGAPENGLVPRVDVSRLRDQLASVAWARSEPWPGEVSIANLHLDACNWGFSPADSPAKISDLELVIDALDFLSVLLGPEDQMLWEARGA
jgi:hypothetical protein